MGVLNRELVLGDDRLAVDTRDEQGILNKK